MNLISPFAPPTFLKPCIVVSTIFSDSLKETAICFTNALNAQDAMRNMYVANSFTKKSQFIVIKQHKTMIQAIKFHTDLAKVMRNNCSEKLWEKGYEEYDELYQQYCPENLKTKV